MSKFQSSRISVTVLLTAMFAVSFSTDAFPQIKIMPLGNSITRGVTGSTDNAGYRNDLAQLLIGEGIFFDFVGSLVDGTGFDPSHEGHDGFRADQILQNINTYLNNSNPDMVILHIGTNDISNDQTSVSTRDDIAGIIDAIHAFDPSIKIILSSIVPRDDEKDAQTTTLNNLVEALFYTKRDDEGRNLFYAGANEIFKQNPTWQTDYLSDNVHPTDAGYNIMGEVFFNAVMVAFNSTTTEVTDNFERSSLGMTWDADPEYVIQNGDLANTATSGGTDWEQMATYKAIKNPTSVAVQWAADVDNAGLTEAGLALLLDAPSRTADGYLAWITPGDNQLHLWTIRNGVTDQDQLVVNPQSQASPPAAGSVLRVDVAVSLSNLQFDYYVNDIFAGSVTLSNPGVTGERYAGFISKHSLSNDIAEFSLKKTTDTTKPDFVDNLVASTPTATTITLGWTAKGDDGSTGQASSYDLRFSTFNINDANFEQAIPVTGVPAPALAGTPESFVVTALQPGTQYNFAIKVIDEAGNVSDISNIASATTVAGNVVVDDFNRSGLGSKWTTAPDYTIVNNQLSNTSLSDIQWNEMAVYNDRKKPTEVSFRWGDNADAGGIDQGGFLIVFGTPSANANGYAISRRTQTSELRLWEVVDGEVTNVIEKNSSPALSAPQPGDIVKIQIIGDDAANKFDFFKNGVFDGRVEDVSKIHDLGGDYWAGVALRGNRNNDLDDFTILLELGAPTNFVPIAGEAQVDTVNQELPIPLTVRITDDAGSPIQGINVNFAVIAGGGSVDVAPPKEDIVLEAENGVLTSPMVSATDAAASKGAYVHVPDGTGGDAQNPGIATYTINIETESDYLIWGRAIYPNPNADAFKVIVDGVAYNWDIGQRVGQDTWHWDAVTHRGSGTPRNPEIDPVVLHLVPGLHTIKIQEAKDGAKLDQFVITRLNSGFLPPADQGPVQAGGTFTDADGQASTKLRLGPAPGVNQVQATATGFSPLLFTATGRAGRVNVITKLSGDGQTGDRGQQLAQPFVVQLRDEFGNLAGDAPTTWTIISGNGTLSQTSPVTTDAQGQAQNTLTLATDTGLNQVRVTAAGYSGQDIIFVATPNPGAAAAITLHSGDSQVGTASKPLATPLRVSVTDDIGTPVPNHSVTFAVTGGSGSVAPVTTTTQADGTAETVWTLGSEIGDVHQVQATALGVPGSVIFNASAAPPVSFEPISPLAHQGIAGIPLPDSIKIRIKDALGETLPDYEVEFSIITAGGFEQGHVNGSTDPVTVRTDQNGIARVEWRLGPQAGTNNNKLRATASFSNNPINGAPIEFTASAQIGTATTLIEISGNNQSGFIDTQLAQPFVVQVTDGNNPVEGWLVAFEMVAGGGHFDNGLTTRNAPTDANGRASVFYTLGSVSGTPQNPFNNVVRAVAENAGQGLTNSPIEFRASALASSAANLQPAGGDNQTGAAGEPLPQQIKVQVTDAAGNGINGHEVVFKVTAGGGTLNGETDTQVSEITDGTGNAAVTWYLGGTLGTNSQKLEARANDGINDLSGSPMVFQASSFAGAVDPTVSTVTSDLTAVQANGQDKATITVTLTDKFGNAIPDKAITLISSGNGNIFTQPQNLTDANGRATGTLASTVAEIKTITARIIGGLMLESSVDVAFIPEPPERVTLNDGNNQTTNVGTALQRPIEVIITDRFNNPVPGVTVRFEVIEGGGFILNTNSPPPGESQVQHNETVTNSEGKAWANWVVGPAPDTNTAIARAFFSNQELSGSPVTFTAIAVNATAVRMQLHGGGTQENVFAGTKLPQPLEVKVTDNSGNPVAGVSVNFNVTLGEGTVENPAPKSNHLGLARTAFTLGPTVGANEVDATNSNLSGSPVIFRFESVTGGPSKIMRESGNDGTATVNGALVVSIKITDLFDNPVENADANFEVVQGGGGILSHDEKSNSLGVARATVLMPQNAAEVLVKASSDDLPGFFVTFTLHAVAGSAANLLLYDGDNQEGTIARPLVYPLQVRVTDGFGNPVSGIEIRWIGTIGGGNVTPDRSTTDETGVAAADFTLGSQPGTNKAQAFSAISLNPSQIEFTAIGVSNNFPQFANLADQQITEGSLLQFQVSATDADGDPVTYEAENLPAGASFSAGSATFRWTPGPDQEGEHEVTFIARDNRGGLDAGTVTITVRNNNNPPVIASFQPAQTEFDVLWGSVIHFSVQVDDADNDHISYDWRLFSAFAPNGQLLSTSQAFDFDTNNTEPATDSIRVVVTDGQDADTLSWAISVFVSVELSSFSADFAGFDGVKISWQTSREINNAGFNILRSTTPDGDYAQVNAELIPPDQGGQYEFIDRDLVVGRRYFYILEDVDVNGTRTEHGPIQIDIAAPKTFQLSQNFPNPFNPDTKIRYQLPQTGKVTIRIFDVLGREVKTLVDERKEAGFHVLTWDAKNQDGIRVASGIYYYSISAGDFKMTKKMLLLK
ncbi:MAG: Ig-like domain-containing protein [bacterium]